jgi:hypothetical protein
MMTNPDLRASLHRATAPAAPRKTFIQRLKAAAQQTRVQAAELATAVVRGTVKLVRSVRSLLAGQTDRIQFAWRLRKMLLAALGIGLAVTAVSYVSAHGIAAALSGAGAAAATMAVQAGLWIRKSVGRLAAN